MIISTAADNLIPCGYLVAITHYMDDCEHNAVVSISCATHDS